MNTASPMMMRLGGALLLTSVIAIVAKIIGVVVAPGARGVGGQAAVTFIDTTSGTFAYVLTALLVAVVCAASFELARRRTVRVLTRGTVVAATGLILALASPAVVERLRTLPSLSLGVVTSAIVLVAGVAVLRRAETRALGGVLALLSIAGLLRVVAWETSAIGFERASASLYEAARGLSTAAVAAQAFAVLLTAAWIGTRSAWRGRVLANAAIVLAFAITWLAARSSEAPSAIESVLRTTIPRAAGLPSPYLLESIAAFLVPASILLAAVALVQRADAVIASAFALALLSHGAFDVPLQALLATASAEWALLAMSERASSAAALEGRPVATAPSVAPDGGSAGAASHLPEEAPPSTKGA